MDVRLADCIESLLALLYVECMETGRAKEPSVVEGNDTDARRSCAIDRVGILGFGGDGMAVIMETRVALLREGKGIREAVIIFSMGVQDIGRSPTVLDRVLLTA